MTREEKIMSGVADAFTEKVENKGNPEVDELLEMVQYNIMKIAIRMELTE